MKNFLHLLGCAVVIFLLCSSFAMSQTKTGSSRGEELLSHLIGNWDMVGKVEGQSVKYSFEAARVLHDKFLFMHMKDLAVPSPYEADIYIGYDMTHECYVTFWMDNFGVDSSVSVLGYGRKNGDTLVIIFNFPNEPFRDTFTYDPATDKWRFLLEDGNLQGTWKTFADYTLTRKRF